LEVAVKNMVDIVIPVLNEEKILREKDDYYSALKDSARIIFVDGGSEDSTVQLAKRYGEVFLSKPGRAFQKNLGAKQARSDYLVFLHVDSFISLNSFPSIKNAIDQGAAGGCLTMRIDDKGFMFRVYEWTVNFRAKNFGVIDGDLGMFVKRSIFEKVGGFDELPIMEDLRFGKKLRRAGRVKVLKDNIHVSARTWHEKGFLKTFFFYTLAYMKLWTGRLKSPRLSHKMEGRGKKSTVPG